LQDKGLDTVDANLKLGRAPDEREYSMAVGILRDLGLRAFKLLTNNPSKIKALSEAGFDVRSEGIEAEPLDENRAYLSAKKSKFGHTLGRV
jgi:3,4-dihydroxy 2-butanone 4-phosphate synthase/GTP cyclohydrolase II